MRVIVPPVLVGNRICRVVAAVESLLEVEEWVGEWWEPSNITLSEASLAERASMDVLFQRGVPTIDWNSGAKRTPASTIAAILLAPVQSRPNDASWLAASPAKRPSPPERHYPGSARFRRGRPAAKDPSDGSSDAERNRADVKKP